MLISYFSLRRIGRSGRTRRLGVALAAVLWLPWNTLEAGTGTSLPPNFDNVALNNATTTFDAADPLSMATGEYYFVQELLDLGGPLPLRFAIGYSSGRGFPLEGGMALRFAHNHYATGLTLEGDEKTPSFTQLNLPLSQDLTFELDGATGEWVQHNTKRIRHQWIETAEYFYLVDPQAAQVHTFKKLLPPVFEGQVTSIRVRLEDRNGNTLHYTNLPTGTHSETEVIRRGPISVHDGLGRQLDFTFQLLGQIQLRNYMTRVEDHTGRGWDLAYEVGPPDNPPGSGVIPLVTLRTLTDPLGGAWTLGYQGNGRVAARTHPAGNAPVSQTYSATLAETAVLTQTSAAGDTWTLSPGPGDPELGTRRDLGQPDGSVRSFFHKDNDTLIGGMIDELGATTSYTQVPDRRAVATATEADGGASELGYEPDSGLIASIRNPREDLTTFTWQAVEQTITNPDNGEQITARFYDLVRVDLPDGSFETTAYDDRGNPILHTDRVGRQWTMTYDARGQMLTRTNPEGGVEEHTYDAAGNLIERTDSDTGTTTYAVDALSRVTGAMHPDGATRTYVYDDLDRLTESVDELGVVRRFAYDANGRPTGVTRAFGTPLARTTTYEWDALNRLARIVDPEGHATDVAYPYFDDPERLELADGTEIVYEYDARRQVVAVVDEAGGRLELERNATGEITALTSPAGRRVELVRDAVGEVTARLDPLGDTTTAVLDPLSRVTSVTDPLLRTHQVERDGEGRVALRAEPEATATAYAYDGNGRPISLTDARGSEWTLGYTAMGRLAEASDPLGRSCQVTYDDRGRPATRVHPDGVTETFVHDQRDDLVERRFSDGLALLYEYDALGRLTGTTDGTGVPLAAGGPAPAGSVPGLGAELAVAFGYDGRDNPVATTFDGVTFTATFDQRNRLASLDYAGQTTVVYERDPRGLVTRVSDTLSAAQVDLEYDADRRLTRIVRANGRTTDLAYDGKGRLSQIDHGALGRLDWVYDAADQPLEIAETGFPLDPGAALAASVQDLSFDAADQVSAPGHAYDPRGRPAGDGTRAYTWDAADRLIRVERDGVEVDYRYSGTGELLERTAGGTTTSYHASASIEGRPTLAERRAGSFVRLYVALPDGTPLYFVDLGGPPSVHYYHYGKVGETRLTSDAAGAVSNAYAYDGFGRLLARTGGSDQHHLYGGRYGVRFDPDAELVHMRARWYDPDLGRFLTRDPVFLALAGRNGQHANPYHYVQGMVTRAVDPSGLDLFFDDMWIFSDNAWAEVEDRSPDSLAATPPPDPATDNAMGPSALLDASLPGGKWVRGFLDRESDRAEDVNLSRALFKAVATLRRLLEAEVGSLADEPAHVETAATDGAMDPFAPLDAFFARAPIDSTVDPFAPLDAFFARMPPDSAVDPFAPLDAFFAQTPTDGAVDPFAPLDAFFDDPDRSRALGGRQLD